MVEIDVVEIECDCWIGIVVIGEVVDVVYEEGGVGVVVLLYC